jgi:hypothetical protein
MADLDLTAFLKEGSGIDVPNLDWLDVNEEDYRKLDRLPKQNLDIVPDLKTLWSHEDPSGARIVPNTGAPRTMGDLSSVHGPISSASESLVRTARLAIMQSTDPMKLQSTLSSRFDGNTIRQSKTALAGVLAERGLLGRHYIESSDFAGCSRGDKTASEFVKRFASDAKFVVAKTACGDCTHNQTLVGGSQHCGVFHKQIVMDVPYTEDLAREVEGLQTARGKAVQASTASPRDRIRKAYLSESHISSGNFTGIPQAEVKPIESGDVGAKLIAISSLTKKRDEAAQAKVAAEKAKPILAALRREMLKGHGGEAIAHSLRLSFDQKDLLESREHWEPLFRQAGLYGTVYTTQDSFSDCREGADFLAKHGSSVRVVVAGDKCGSCLFSKAGRCLMYGRPLVHQASDILTPETVTAVVDEHRIAGRLPQDAHRLSWGSDPVDALKRVHRVASTPKAVTQSQSLSRMLVEKAFHGGGPRQMQANELTIRGVVKSAKQYLNEGLYGQDLMAVLKGRYEVRDIIAAKDELREVLAEQGLQGIVYVDPSAYDDYGNGCKQAASKHRSRGGVKYAKVGSKCGSCVHQTRPGFCSVLSKQLVVEPPYVDKLAEQRAILASGRSTVVEYASLMNNGLSMMQEYQLQHSASDIDLNPEVSQIQADIEFGPHQVKL